MPGALLEAFAEQGCVAVQMDQSHDRLSRDLRSHAEAASVAVFQGGAGQHDAPAIPDRGIDQAGKPVKPWASLLVVERNSLPHDGDVFRRMIVVGIEKLVAEMARQKPPNHSFAAAGNAHDNNCLWLPCGGHCGERHETTGWPPGVPTELRDCGSE